MERLRLHKGSIQPQADGPFVEYADHQQTVERLERENECKDTLIETLQAQLAASEEERRKVSATCDMLGRERNAADEEVHSLKQQVAQLRGVLNTIRRDAGLDCGDNSCMYALEHTGMRTNGGCRCSPKRMKDDLARSRKAFDALQTAHTTLRGLADRVVSALDFSVRALKVAHPIVCSIVCPSVKRDSEEWSHKQQCESIGLTMRTAESELAAYNGSIEPKAEHPPQHLCGARGYRLDDDICPACKEDALPREGGKCEICHGTKGGVPGNENIIDGKVICDYCHAELPREGGAQDTISTKTLPSQYPGNCAEVRGGTS